MSSIMSIIILQTDQEYITIKEGSYIIMTGDKKYAAKCNESRVYMNDHFTLATLKVGAEITIDFGEILLECSELIDSKNIKCLVLKGGQIKDLETVCIRGVRHVKPALMKSDMEIINFAKEYNVSSRISSPHPLRKTFYITSTKKIF